MMDKIYTDKMAAAVAASEAPKPKAELDPALAVKPFADYLEAGGKAIDYPEAVTWVINWAYKSQGTVIDVAQAQAIVEHCRGVWFPVPVEP